MREEPENKVTLLAHPGCLDLWQPRRGSPAVVTRSHERQDSNTQARNSLPVRRTDGQTAKMRGKKRPGGTPAQSSSDHLDDFTEAGMAGATLIPEFTGLGCTRSRGVRSPRLQSSHKAARPVEKVGSQV
jgi:hypothetical protein